MTNPSKTSLLSLSSHTPPLRSISAVITPFNILQKKIAQFTLFVARPDAHCPFIKTAHHKRENTPFQQFQIDHSLLIFIPQQHQKKTSSTKLRRILSRNKAEFPERIWNILRIVNVKSGTRLFFPLRQLGMGIRECGTHLTSIKIFHRGVFFN